MRCGLKNDAKTEKYTKIMHIKEKMMIKKYWKIFLGGKKIK